MKKCILGGAVAVLLVSCQLAHAQSSLAGTSWQGTMRVPNELAIVFEFRQDTVLLFAKNSQVPLEVSLYVQKGNQLTLQKISGNSPCDPQAVGLYTYSITNQQLLIKPLLEPCKARLLAFTAEALQKVAK